MARRIPVTGYADGRCLKKGGVDETCYVYATAGASRQRAEQVPAANAPGRVSLPPDDLIAQSIAQLDPTDRVLTLAKLLLLAGLQKPRSELPLQPFALG